MNYFNTNKKVTEPISKQSTEMHSDQSLASRTKNILWSLVLH